MKFLAFFVVAMLAAATSSLAQLPVVPPHRQIRPAVPPSAGPSMSMAPAVGPSPVFAAMSRIDAKASRALAKAERSLRAARRTAAAPPSPMTEALSSAALVHADNAAWARALADADGDTALARIDPGYQAYLQVRQDPAHQIAAARSLAGTVLYDHSRVMDLREQIADMQHRLGLATDTIQAVARHTATALGAPDRSGREPSKEEKREAIRRLASF